MANMQKKVDRTKIGIVTSWEYDADHTPKKERKRVHPNDEEVRSLMETVRDALAEQGITLEGWWAEQGPYHQIGAMTPAEIKRREERGEPARF